MKVFKKKHIIALLLIAFVFSFSSCRSKKTFNGTAKLDCPDYNPEITEDTEKKKTRWRLVLYKDGEKVGRKKKKGKSRLFKKKVY